MTQLNVPPEAKHFHSAGEIKRADELAVGDWVNDDRFGVGPVRIAALAPWPSHVTIVYTKPGVNEPRAESVAVDRWLVMASDAEVESAARYGRAQQISRELHELGELLLDHDDIPLPVYALDIQIMRSPRITFDELTALGEVLDIEPEQQYGGSIFEVTWPKGRLSYQDGVRVTWSATKPADPTPEPPLPPAVDVVTPDGAGL